MVDLFQVLENAANCVRKYEFATDSIRRIATTVGCGVGTVQRVVAQMPYAR